MKQANKQGRTYGEHTEMARDLTGIPLALEHVLSHATVIGS